MYMPKRSQYRKHQKGRAKAISSNTSHLYFGKYAIKSLTNGRLKASTIEAARRAITRKIKRIGQLWIRVYPDIPVTTKPLEVRMGKGKGSPSHFICRVKAGQILYEMDGISETLGKQAALLAGSKLPMKTVFLTRKV